MDDCEPEATVVSFQKHDTRASPCEVPISGIKGLSGCLSRPSKASATRARSRSFTNPSAGMVTVGRNRRVNIASLGAYFVLKPERERNRTSARVIRIEAREESEPPSAQDFMRSVSWSLRVGSGCTLFPPSW